MLLSILLKREAEAQKQVNVDEMRGSRVGSDWNTSQIRRRIQLYFKERWKRKRDRNPREVVLLNEKTNSRVEKQFKDDKTSIASL